MKQDTIDFSKLWPDGSMERLRKLRDDEMLSYQDERGRLRAELAQARRCPLCGGGAERELFFKEGFRFVQCRDCDMVYVNPRLNDAALGRLYGEGRFTSAYDDFYAKSAAYRQARFYEERMGFIESYFPAKGKLVDIGAARGDFVRTALRHGWDAVGLEISDHARKYARDDELRGRVIPRDIEEAGLADESFEVVTMWELLEHVPEPGELLASVMRILKPGGMVFVYVPNYASAEVALIGEAADHTMGDAHVNYFTPATLRAMLERGGFETVTIYTMGVDVAHVIWNIENLDALRYDTGFLRDHQEILQDIINEAGRGTNLRGFFRKA